MSSVRTSLEAISADGRWLELFEDRLKAQHNLQNMTFWISLRDVKASIEVRFENVGCFEEIFWVFFSFGSPFYLYP